jgi:hypothetical protein
MFKMQCTQLLKPETLGQFVSDLYESFWTHSSVHKAHTCIFS